MNLNEIIRKNIYREILREAPSPPNPSRMYVPKVRGGWNENKILRYLKQNPSCTKMKTAIRMIAQFDNVEEFKRHLFWHGSQYPQSGLLPSKALPKNWNAGGGGYGDRYWGISVTDDKYTATNFCGTGHSVFVHPIILAKDAVVKNYPNLRDAIDLEDIIIDLWNEGVDAVQLGPQSEHETVILNPRCICNIEGVTQSARLYGMTKSDFPEPTEDQLQELLDACKNYQSEPKKPSKPSQYVSYDTGEKKPVETYNQEMENYNKSMDDYKNSDEYKNYQQQLDHIRQLVRL